MCRRAARQGKTLRCATSSTLTRRPTPGLFLLGFCAGIEVQPNTIQRGLTTRQFTGMSNDFFRLRFQSRSQLNRVFNMGFRRPRSTKTTACRRKPASDTILSIRLKMFFSEKLKYLASLTVIEFVMCRYHLTTQCNEQETFSIESRKLWTAENYRRINATVSHSFSWGKMCGLYGVCQMLRMIRTAPRKDLVHFTNPAVSSFSAVNRAQSL